MVSEAAITEHTGTTGQDDGDNSSISYSTDKLDEESSTKFTENDEASSSVQSLAKTEDLWVSRSRWLVFIVLTTVAIVVAFVTYRFTSKAQQDKFEGGVSHP